MLRAVVEGNQLAEGGRLQFVRLVDDQDRMVGRHAVQVFGDHLQKGRNVGIASARYATGTFGKLQQELARVPLLGLHEDNGSGQILIEEMFQCLRLSAACLVGYSHPHALLLAGTEDEFDLPVVPYGGDHLPAVFLVA